MTIATRRRLVIIESPYRPRQGLNLEQHIDEAVENLKYARACLRHSLDLGEAPIASHLLYTQPGVLNDSIEHERNIGILAGLAWLRVAEASVIYTDYGISPGMEMGIAAALDAGVPVEYRSFNLFKRSIQS